MGEKWPRAYIALDGQLHAPEGEDPETYERAQRAIVSETLKAIRDRKSTEVVALADLIYATKTFQDFEKSEYRYAMSITPGWVEAFYAVVDDMKRVLPTFKNNPEKATEAILRESFRHANRVLYDDQFNAVRDKFGPEAKTIAEKFADAHYQSALAWSEETGEEWRRNFVSLTLNFPNIPVATLSCAKVASPHHQVKEFHDRVQLAKGLMQMYYSKWDEENREKLKQYAKSMPYMFPGMQPVRFGGPPPPPPLFIPAAVTTPAPLSVEDAIAPLYAELKAMGPILEEDSYFLKSDELLREMTATYVEACREKYGEDTAQRALEGEERLDGLNRFDPDPVQQYILYKKMYDNNLKLDASVLGPELADRAAEFVEQLGVSRETYGKLIGWNYARRNYTGEKMQEMLRMGGADDGEIDASAEAERAAAGADDDDGSVEVVKKSKAEKRAEEAARRIADTPAATSASTSVPVVLGVTPNAPIDRAIAAMKDGVEARPDRETPYYPPPQYNPVGIQLYWPRPVIFGSVAPIDRAIGGVPNGAVRAPGAGGNFGQRMAQRRSSEKAAALLKARAHWAQHPRGEKRDKRHTSKSVVRSAAKYVPSRNDFPGVDTRGTR